MISRPAEQNLSNQLSVMNDQAKTKCQLIAELQLLRQEEARSRKRNEARIKNIFQVVPTGIGVVSNRILIDANDRLCDIVGYSRDELIGKNARILYPNDAEYDYVGSEKYRQIRQCGLGTVETKFRRKDGKIINVLLSSSPSDATVSPSKGVTFSVLDITERKQSEKALRESEARYRLLLSALPVAVFTCDAEGRINLYNQAAFSLWQRKPKLGRDRWCGSPRVYRPDGTPLPPEESPVALLLRTGESRTDQELIFERPDGSRVHTLPHPEPLRDPSGRINGVVNVLVDITELRQAEQSMLKLNEALERRVKHRTTALKKSQNQFRQLSNELLQAQENERKRVANEIHDNAGQVLSAVKYRVEAALLKVKREQPTLDLKPIEDLVPLIQQCVEDMRRLQMELRPSMLDEMGLLAAIHWFCRQFQTTHPSIRIHQEITITENDVPEQLKIVVFRVLQEAMNNAGKYSEADLLLLSVHKKTGLLTLHIEDNGRGFDVEHAQHVQAFNKGLGLSSMRERVQYSGGRLLIQSAPGSGTCIEARWSKKLLV
ncbi:MAG TPA: PAS domain S-box protein [Thermodesulfobacteriota bacterium]|nr:PAS domain S-box protein [Thermodesulfobacteriota bacterium]HNU72763.1 PAS domain S-box protein [Thermodesulfobacteriota bacterium]